MTAPDLKPPYLKPLPLVSEENRPFWDGLREREFRGPRCRDCGQFGWVPYPACRVCFGTDIEWVPLSGEGVIFSYTVVHRGPAAFAGDVPYVIVLVELAEQPRPMVVMGLLDDCPHEEIRVGLPVRVTFHDIPGEDVTLYRFAPDTDDRREGRTGDA